MATVDMRHANFWLPNDFHPNKKRPASQKHHRGLATVATSQNQAVPMYNKAGSRLRNSSKSKFEPKRIPVNDRQGCTARSVDHRNEAQEIMVRDHDSVSSNDDDTLPPLEEALRNVELRRNIQDSAQHLNNSGFYRSGKYQTKLQLGNSNSDNRGTQDHPVILDDHETNSPSIETTAIPSAAHDSTEPAPETNKPGSPVNQEAWYDIEYGCYVLEDPLPPLEKDDLAPAVAQDDHPSLGLSQDAGSPHSDGNTGNTPCTAQEPGADSLPHPRRKDSEHGYGESAFELEKDMLKAFKEQEDLSSANIPNPPNSHHSSPEPACLQLDQGPDQGVPKVLNDAPPPRAQLRKETDVIPNFLGHQPQGKAADGVGEVEDGGSEPEQAQTVQKQSHEGETENIRSHIQSPECRASSQVIHSKEEEDEEDEEPRPAKRRKRISQLTHQTPVHIEQHISQTSRSSSATGESVPVAEYQEWPFEGFLKRTRIGNETTYNLEFKLPCLPKLLSLPIEPCEGNASTPPKPSEAPHSSISSTASRPRINGGWKEEEDKTLVDMKRSGCSWKAIFAALPHRTPGSIQVRWSTKLKSRLA